MAPETLKLIKEFEEIPNISAVNFLTNEKDFELSVETFSKLKPDFNLLMQNYPKGEQLIPFENATFAHWSGRTKDGNKCEFAGMRHKMTKKRHGPVRTITGSGSIVLGTYHQDQKHGLQIRIAQSNISVGFFDQNMCLSKFNIDGKKTGLDLSQLSPENLHPTE